MRVCPEACSLFWATLSLACFWYSRCRLEQAWHRVSSGMGGAPHSIQMPRSLALSLLSWVLRRINSLRSGVWARWRSYSRRFSCLASSSARVGSTRGFGVLGWGVAFRDVFTAGLFQLWGRPLLLAGFGREKVNSKVWPIAHSCGDTRGRSKKYPTELYKLWKELDGKEENPLEDLVEHCTVADAMEVPENEPGQF